MFKLQEAAALWIPEVNTETVAALAGYADTIYLTQTTQLRDGELTRFLNIQDAVEAWRANPGPGQWRTHFHVPVFLDDLGPFRTTRFAIEDALKVHAKAPVSDHLEIETYTWDVLPDHLKTADITAYVTRELNWVQETLQAAARRPFDCASGPNVVDEDAADFPPHTEYDADVVAKFPVAIVPDDGIWAIMETCRVQSWSSGAELDLSRW